MRHDANSIPGVDVSRTPDPVVSDNRNLGANYSGAPGSGTYTFTRVPLPYLIAQAYGLEPYQVSGPAWLQTEAYDVTVTSPPEEVDRWGQMMVNLLTERFGLKTHRESTESPGYELTLAPDAPKPTPLAETDAPPAFLRTSRALDGVWHFDFNSTRMMQRVLGFVPHPGPGPGPKIPIADKTGLDGKFDFHLEFVLPESEDLLQGLTTELRQQLGLILKPARVEVELLVVDHAARIPTDN